MPRPTTVRGGDDAPAPPGTILPVDVHTHPVRLACEPVRRLEWLGIGLVAGTLAVIQVANHGSGALTVAIIAAVALDLTMFIGLNRKLTRGQLARRAVPFYNAAHRVWGPLLRIAVGVARPGSATLLAGGLSWLAHVGLDRGLGFRQRTPEGFQRG